MFDSISDMMKELPSDMDGVYATHAPLDLFSLNGYLSGQPITLYFNLSLA